MFYLPPLWPLAVASLSVSKILDNMEIGHNVMHGQYDWMGDPGLNSRMYDWDTVCPGEQWKYSHNYIHHTYTNILGKDRDIGYGILRMDEDQQWRPQHLLNPVNAVLLMLLFEWGVALHDLEVENLVAGKRKMSDNKPLYPGLMRKIRNQTVKDYLLFPALTGPLFPLTLAGNATANLVRNIWAFNIIFCGHFPAGVATFSEEECEDETRGHWYYRQLLGSANITGGKLFHTMSGNLSHQIEHHLFPDLPARRYPEIAVEVQEICERYGLQYNTGRCPSSCSASPRRSAGWHCRTASPGPRPRRCDRGRVGCLTSSGQTGRHEPSSRTSSPKIEPSDSATPRSARTPCRPPSRRRPARSARWPRSSPPRCVTWPPPSAASRPRSSRSATRPRRRRTTDALGHSVGGSWKARTSIRPPSALDAFAAHSTAVASSATSMTRSLRRTRGPRRTAR